MSKSYADKFNPSILGGMEKEDKDRQQSLGIAPAKAGRSYSDTFNPSILGGTPKATGATTSAGTADIDAMLKNLGSVPTAKAPSSGNIVTKTPPAPKSILPAPVQKAGEYTDKAYRALEFATKGLQSGMTFGLLPKITDLIPGSDPRTVTPQTGFERGMQTAGTIAGSAVPTRAIAKAIAPTATAGAKKAGDLLRAIPMPAKAVGGMAAAGAGAEAMLGATNPEIKERSLPAKAGASFRAGVGDVLDIAGSAAKWKGYENLGDNLTARGDKIREGYEIAPKGEFSWRSLLDPDFYAVNVTRSAPFTMVLIPAMIAGWKSGGAIGARAGLGTFGKTVLSAAGGASLSRPIESALEAGGTYEDALAKGMTPEAADKAANEVFWKNMKLVGMDAAQLAAAFAPTPAKFATATAGKAGKVALGTGRIGTGALLEGGEEGYQEAIQRQALGDDTRSVWEQIKTADPHMQEAMAIGGVFGAGMGGAGVMVDTIRQRTVENLPPEQKQEVQAKVVQVALSGADPQQAMEQALDEVAATPEGKKAVEKATKEVAHETEQRLLALPLGPDGPMLPPGSTGQLPPGPPDMGGPPTLPPGLPPVPPVPPAKAPKVEATTAEVVPGAVVYGKKDGKPYTVVGTTDPAMLTVRNENGTEQKIGRKAVKLEALQGTAGQITSSFDAVADGIKAEAAEAFRSDPAYSGWSEQVVGGEVRFYPPGATAPVQAPTPRQYPELTKAGFDSPEAAVRWAYDEAARRLSRDGIMPDEVLAKEQAEVLAERLGVSKVKARRIYADMITDMLEQGLPADIKLGDVRDVKNSLGRIKSVGQSDRMLGVVRVMRQGQEQEKAPETAASNIEKIELKLAADVDESVGTVTPKVGLSVKVVGRKKGQKQSSKHEFIDPDIEARWQAAKGVPRESLIMRARQMISDFIRLATREFEHLPRTGEFSRLRFDLSRIQKYMGVAGDRTLRMLQAITLDMSKEQYDLFTRKVILDDLVQVAAEGKKLPFGFTEEVLEKEAARINETVKADPDVEKAVSLRKDVWGAVKTDYLAAMNDIGADVSGRLAREDYFRHQVLEYTKVKRAVAGTGKKLKTPLNRGFLKKREGSELDINTEYVQAEYEVMAQMLFDIEVAKAIKGVDKNYNIAAELKQEHGKEWRENIPEGYVTWQPREGTVFYMASSVPEAVAEQLYSGAMQELGVKEDDLRKVFAKGQRYKEMVIKEEIAATLDNMLKTPSSNPVSQFTRDLQRRWKVWTLISPRRWFKYNFRNISGDADAAFAGNPASFKKVPQATKELYRVYAGDGAMTPDMRDWFDRGGMQTLLQAQELGDINNLKMFVELTEKKGKAEEVPLRAWQGYWKAARMSTDFREAILRYATYLSYLEQMKANPDGRPKNFGASIREEVMALDNAKDRAFKLSNELLGAYDQIGVIGQALRDHVIPFWSWNEVNFRRYKQLIKNAANDGQLAHVVGRKLLTGVVVKSPLIAYRVGKLALKLWAFWILLSIWNKTRYPELEERLSETERRMPHIIFGEDKNGNIIYFGRLGALQDAIDWVGFDGGSIGDLEDILNGKKTLKEVAAEMAGEPANKLIQGVTPFVKLPMELLSGKKFFPDAFKPGQVRDRGLHTAQAFGLENEYKAVMKLPSRPYEKSLQNLFVYSQDPGQTSYYSILEEKRRFQKEIDKYSEGSFRSAKGDALYNFKIALRLEDREAAIKYLTLYVQHGGTDRGLEQSLEAMHPLHGLNKEDQVTFVEGLGKERQKELREAINFYENTLLGK